MKLWETKCKLNKEIEEYTVGSDYSIDQKIVKHDCMASIAHAKMLCKINILTKEECNKIIATLKEIIELENKGLFKINKEHEDCHTAIENFLIKKLGEIGKKIHAARSRNDQVVAALRLYYKDEINSVLELMENLVDELISFKDKYDSVPIPGYTHTRKAMPSSVGVWADSFIEAMNDNKKLLQAVYQLMDKSPLGTGAGYGLPIEVDWKMTAELLDFKDIQRNPLYVQNSRGKYEASLLHCLGQIMLDLNKMSSDIILFSMPELGYFELDDSMCTGSSIMPHKKNPDVLELIRAKYHQVMACEFEVKTLISNLISGYNRDLQLTKKPTFDGIQITKESLNIMKIVLENLRVNKNKCDDGMTDELYAVKKVYDLVKEGIPFRDAYKRVSREYN